MTGFWDHWSALLISNFALVDYTTYLMYKHNLHFDYFQVWNETCRKLNKITFVLHKCC